MAVLGRRKGAKIIGKHEFWLRRGMKEWDKNHPEEISEEEWQMVCKMGKDRGKKFTEDEVRTAVDRMRKEKEEKEPPRKGGQVVRARLVFMPRWKPLRK